MGQRITSICLGATTLILGMAMATAGPLNSGYIPQNGSIQHMPPPAMPANGGCIPRVVNTRVPVGPVKLSGM